MASVQVDHIHHYNDYSQAPQCVFQTKDINCLFGYLKAEFPFLPFHKKTQVESRAAQLSNHQALHYEEWLPAV